MKNSAFLKRFSRSKAKQHAIYAVIQPDEIYFSSSEQLSLPDKYPLANQPWPQALIGALSTISAKGLRPYITIRNYRKNTRVRVSSL